MLAVVHESDVTGGRPVVGIAAWLACCAPVGRSTPVAVPSTMGSDVVHRTPPNTMRRCR